TDGQGRRDREPLHEHLGHRLTGLEGVTEAGSGALDRPLPDSVGAADEQAGQEGGELLEEGPVKTENEEYLVVALRCAVIPADLDRGIQEQQEEDHEGEQAHDKEHAEHARRPADEESGDVRIPPDSLRTLTRSPSTVNENTIRY